MVNKTHTIRVESELDTNELVNRLNDLVKSQGTNEITNFSVNSTQGTGNADMFTNQGTINPDRPEEKSGKLVTGSGPVGEKNKSKL
jgi:hypothetical protein